VQRSRLSPGRLSTVLTAAVVAAATGARLHDNPRRRRQQIAVMLYYRTADALSLSCQRHLPSAFYFFCILFNFLLFSTANHLLIGNMNNRQQQAAHLLFFLMSLVAFSSFIKTVKYCILSIFFRYLLSMCQFLLL